VEIKVDGCDIVRLSVLRPKVGQECHEDDVVVEACLGLINKPLVIYPKFEPSGRLERSHAAKRHLPLAHIQVCLSVHLPLVHIQICLSVHCARLSARIYICPSILLCSGLINPTISKLCQPTYLRTGRPIQSSLPTSVCSSAHTQNS
jgi:hypothetical protein